MIFSKPHKNEPEAMQMEKTKGTKGKKRGAGRAGFRGHICRSRWLPWC